MIDLSVVVAGLVDGVAILRAENGDTQYYFAVVAEGNPSLMSPQMGSDMVRGCAPWPGTFTGVDTAADYARGIIRYEKWARNPCAAADSLHVLGSGGSIPPY